MVVLVRLLSFVSCVHYSDCSCCFLIAVIPHPKVACLGSGAVAAVATRSVQHAAAERHLRSSRFLIPLSFKDSYFKAFFLGPKTILCKAFGLF